AHLGQADGHDRPLGRRLLAGALRPVLHPAARLENARAEAARQAPHLRGRGGHPLPQRRRVPGGGVPQERAGSALRRRGGLRRPGGALLAPRPPAPPAAGPSVIINGQPTGDNSFSNVGALLFDFDRNGIITGDDALCSGSLIAPTVFLTAAHCVSFFPADAQLYVSFDADLFASGLQAIAATAFHFDPGFGHDLGDLHDVAVVLLPAGSTTTTPPFRL